MSEPTYVATPRNCFRCGDEFTATDSARICPKCRKPVTHERHALPFKPPSFRENQVIERVALGLANKEIAAQLHLAEGTIKEYLNRIFRKLKVTNRTELAIWAIAHRGDTPA